MASETQEAPPFVGFLALDNIEEVIRAYRELIVLLRTRTVLRRISTSRLASHAFTSDDRPIAILCTDQSLATQTPERQNLLAEASNYVREGGTLVFMGLFVATPGKARDLNDLFKHFSLPWRRSDHRFCSQTLNAHMTHFDTSGLVAHYDAAAVHLANVENQDAVYLPSKDPPTSSTPADRQANQALAAFRKHFEGAIGFVGALVIGHETADLIIAMCGLEHRPRPKQCLYEQPPDERPPEELSEDELALDESQIPWTVLHWRIADLREMSSPVTSTILRPGAST